MDNLKAVTLSVLIPAYRSQYCLENSVDELHGYLSRSSALRFEILIVPNGSETCPDFIATRKIAHDLSERYAEVRTSSTEHGQIGKGHALCAAFRECSGEFVFLMDSDLPYDLDFIPRALEALRGGVEYVFGNRSLPESRITLSGEHLPAAARRRRLSRGFNRVARTLLGIHSLDTQAGMKAMTHRFAAEAFGLQRTGGFLFDLEHFLIALRNGFRTLGLPVHLLLRDHRSSVRPFRELVRVTSALFRIWLNDRLGAYRIVPPLDGPRFHTADDWGLSPAVNRGILDLARRGMIHRVSVLVDGSYVEEGLSELRTLPDVQIGLHYNLTYRNLTYRNLTSRNRTDGVRSRYAHRGPTKLLLRSFFHRILGERWSNGVESEFKRQLTELRNFGVDVRHVDGHHHVHLFPGIVDRIAPLCRVEGISELRLALDYRLLFTAKFILPLFSLRARPIVERLGIRSLPFRYPSTRDLRSRNALDRLLQENQSTEILFHPADFDDLRSPENFDPYRGRVEEYCVLLGCATKVREDTLLPSKSTSHEPPLPHYAAAAARI